MRPNKMRQKLESGQAAIGVNVQIDSPWLVELIGMAGFDFVMLDGEHGAAFNNLPALIMAADVAGTTPIVRVPSHERGYILPALEAGAGGIQVTMVNTPEEAQMLVNETRFAPLGNRGYSNATRAANYGAIPKAEYAELANRETLLILQVETKEALANLDAIADVAGVDAVFFGSGDLSQSLGYFAEQDAAPVREAIHKAVELVKGRVYAASNAYTQDDIRFWRGVGVSSFLTSSIHPLSTTFANLWSDLSEGLD
jgi:4-hydroxy-2-oxoheptanedioate aldolase